MPAPSSPLLLRRRLADGSSRWLLLGAVLIGLLALQFLGGHDAAGHHRLPGTPTAVQIQAQPQTGQAPGAQAAAPSIDQHPANGPAAVAGCCLLLLTASAVALGQARRRRTSERRPPSWSIPADGPRGPPLARCRQALCVQRI